MKTIKLKLLLLIILLLPVYPFFAKAQITKNSFLVGSHLNLDFNRITLGPPGGPKNQLPITYSFSINPKIGFFLMDNLALGVDVNFATSKDTGRSFTTTQQRSQFLMGPFVRYYISLSDNIYLFPDLSLGLGLRANEDVSYSLLGFGAGPGLAFFLAENISLEAMAKYNYLTSANADRSDVLNNLNFSIGMFYYFRQRAAGLR